MARDLPAAFRQFQAAAAGGDPYAQACSVGRRVAGGPRGRGLQGSGLQGPALSSSDAAPRPPTPAPWPAAMLTAWPEAGGLSRAAELVAVAFRICRATHAPAPAAPPPPAVQPGVHAHPRDARPAELQRRTAPLPAGGGEAAARRRQRPGWVAPRRAPPRPDLPGRAAACPLLAPACGRPTTSLPAPPVLVHLDVLLLWGLQCSLWRGGLLRATSAQAPPLQTAGGRCPCSAALIRRSCGVAPRPAPRTTCRRASLPRSGRAGQPLGGGAILCHGRRPRPRRRL